MKLVDPDFSQRRVSRVHEDSAGLRDQEKLSLQQIGDRFDRSACRAAQIYQAARHKIQFPPNGLSNRLNHLLTKPALPSRSRPSPSRCAQANFTPISIRPPTASLRTVIFASGLALIPATVLRKGSYYETYRANGLSYRVNHILKYAGIPATKEAVLKSLKNGSLTPTKRPIGYGKMTHAELCRWVGVTPHLFRSRKKTAS